MLAPRSAEGAAHLEAPAVLGPVLWPVSPASGQGLHLLLCLLHAFLGSQRHSLNCPEQVNENVCSQGLFHRVLREEISLAKLVRMKPEELVSKELSTWKERPTKPVSAGERLQKPGSKGCTGSGREPTKAVFSLGDGAPSEIASGK